MHFQIVITFDEIRLRPDSVRALVEAYSAADLTDLEEHLEFSQFTFSFLQVQFSDIPNQFDSDIKFYEAYLARIKEIAAPLTFQLN
jgi:hypothetical protein